MDSRGCGDRCHRLRAEAVDRPLQDDGADGGDGKLQTHRQTDRRHEGHALKIRLEVGVVQIQHRHLLRHVDETGNARQKLGKYRRPGCALHAKTEVLHEQDIKEDVDNHRRDQEVQRGAAVAQGAQNGGAEIVQHGRADAHEDDEDVAVCLFDDLRRGVHQTEQIVRPEKADQPDHRCDAEAQPHQLRRAAADALHIARAEALGNRNCKAGAGAGGEAEDQEVERSRRTEGGEGVEPQDTADEDAVGQIVKLLKQVADQKRRAEAQDIFERRTRRHVMCHSEFFFPKPRIGVCGGFAAPDFEPIF